MKCFLFIFSLIVTYFNEVLLQTYHELKINSLTKGIVSKIYKLVIQSDIDITRKDLIIKLKPIIEKHNGRFSNPDLWISKVI